MAIRLNVDVNDTTALLKSILTHTKDGHRVLFLTEPSRGEATMQRVRVKLSRWRKDRQRQGKKRRYFILSTTIHSHTEKGKRYDAVVVWEKKTLSHKIAESLEDLAGSGDLL